MNDVLDEIKRQAAALRARRFKAPVRARMNPDDTEALIERHSIPDFVKRTDLSRVTLWSVAGVPVSEDESVPVGHPVVEYE